MSNFLRKEAVISGLLACGTDGKLHKPTRASTGSHSFGAAAVRNGETGDVTVTLYTEVHGNRVGELYYAGEDWDSNFVEPLVEANRNGIGEAYLALDGLLKTFGHRSLDTMVKIDPENPVEEEQVILEQAGGKRIITDSMRAFQAFVTAAGSEERPFSSQALLEITTFVPASEYFVQPPSLTSINA